MDENNQKKISLKTAIIIILVLIVIAFIYVNMVRTSDDSNINNSSINISNNNSGNNYSYRYYDDNDEFHSVKRKAINFEKQCITLDKTEDLRAFEVCEYMNYSNYITYCEKWNIEQRYFFKDYNYIIFSYYCKDENGTDSIDADLLRVEYNNEETMLYIWDGDISYTTENTCAAYVIVIPTQKEPNHVNYIGCSRYWNKLQAIDKPIIYLYPTEDTELSVKLGHEDKITSSYPQYTTGWNVLAKTNGDLIDLDTKRKLYALYYESEAVYDFGVQEDGFIVKGTDVAEFLEEKLAILGLTEREAEEFIVYWMPKLQKNEYNYIRFATMEEITANMPLEFSVEPDTLIRVLMTFKGLKNPISVQEQQLETPNRTGFVAVEWGGTEIQ